MTDKITMTELDGYVTAIQNELRTILLSKHKDYGPTNIAGAPGGPLNGLRVRMWDKLARINHLIENGDTPNHESLIDSFIDLANYAIISILVQRGQWEGITPKVVKVTSGIKNPKESTYPVGPPGTISRPQRDQDYRWSHPGGKA